MTPAPSLQDLIETVRRDAGDDELDQLATARAMVNDLSETGDALLGHYVDRARRSGRSWTEISNVLGVTKQAVHKRWAGPSIEGFERFTARARTCLAAAGDTARAMGHNYVGTEHLLLGLYAEPQSIAARILTEAGTGPAAVHEAVRTRLAAFTPPEGAAPAKAAGQELPRTPRANAALGAAVTEALQLGHNYIGTEHLLLGLYHDSGSVAAQVLAELGPDKQTVHDKVVELLAGFTNPAT
ncbi:Clp protease N-terminal domain-containing protein [Actinopolymorpha singaporensis]|uniref:Clp amino terminal domain-containing protein, pathogenicity island component n=1 Tax=Actinopolymorpha singaporensis TaxID=117157 RepID=A0A1H1WJX4_9ACTN|nr:Clp protease N-terminal domain-containing protein [Actinopolymorpha singaporensis]SDS97617.1 Clp amino terminal domain-containing protein, pathogenicity island component [Actinopolymorpha singaporensis]